MKKQLKTLLFIMNHGRMRLGLVKRIQKAQRREYGRMFIEKHGRAPNMPAFNPSPPPKRKFTTTRMQPKTDPPRGRTRPSKPYPEPKEKFISFPHKKRKSTDNEIVSKDPSYQELMKVVSDEIQELMTREMKDVSLTFFDLDDLPKKS